MCETNVAARRSVRVTGWWARERGSYPTGVSGAWATRFRDCAPPRINSADRGMLWGGVAEVKHYRHGGVCTVSRNVKICQSASSLKAGFQTGMPLSSLPFVTVS